MKPPAYFTIPKGTASRPCPGCKAPIYLIAGLNDIRIPVDVAVPAGLTPTKDDNGMGVSHFTICPASPRRRMTTR